MNSIPYLSPDMFAKALFLLVLGSVVGYGQVFTPEVPVSPPEYGPAPGSQSSPRIATNGGGYLVVWHDSRAGDNIYGTRLDATGRVLDPTGILIARVPSVPAVAAVGSDYLVVFLRSCNVIEVVRVTADGFTSEPKQIVDSSLTCVGIPSLKIASNGDELLVTSEPGRAVLLDRYGDVLKAPFAVDADSYRISVDSNGHDFLIASLVSKGATLELRSVGVSKRGDLGVSTLLQNAAGATSVDVASSGSNYLVVVAGRELRAQVVNSDGTAASTPRSISNPDLGALQAGVAWSGTEYVVIFTQPLSPPESYVQLIRLSVGADPLSPARPIPPTPRIAVTSDFEMVMRLDGGVLLTWNYNGDIYVAAASQDSSLDGKVISVSASSQSFPLIVPTRFGFAIFWREYSPTRGFIIRATTFNEEMVRTSEVIEIVSSSYLPFYAAYDGLRLIVTWIDDGSLFVRRFTADLRPIDPDPVLITNDEVWEYALAAGDDRALIVWIAPGPNFNSYGDIYGAALKTNDLMLSPTRLTIAELPYDDYAPTASWTGTEFMILWGHAVGPPPRQGAFPEPPTDLIAVRLNPDGSIADRTPRIIAHVPTRIDTTSVASNGRDSYAAWLTLNWEVYGAAFITDGLPVAPTPTMISPANLRSARPLVLRDDSSFVVVWTTEWYPYHYALHFRRVTAGLTGPIFSFPVLESVFFTSSGFLILHSNQFVVAYVRIAHEKDYGGVARVFVREMAPTSRRRPAVRH